MSRTTRPGKPLGEQYGLLPLEIVYFNFKTFDPDEVNWYLHHYVRCRKATRDGLNWMFSSGLDKEKRLPGQRQPGVVYIPPKTITVDEPDVITLRRPPPYFTVRVHPRDWSPPYWMTRKWNQGEQPPAYSVYERAARNVVTITPWQRQNSTLNGVPIIGRKGWHAAEPLWRNEVIYYNRFSYPLFQTLDTIVVHHTDNDDPIGDVEAEHKKGRRRRVKFWQRTGPYAAIGYHFFIDKQGKIFEGRPLEIMGSHAGAGPKNGPHKDPVLDDPDWGKIGIVLQGDYHGANEPPDLRKALNKQRLPALDTQLQSLQRLVVAIYESYRIKRLLMHREVKGRVGDPTDCPGDIAAPRIVELRKRLGLPGP
jgi:N-acetylmuramoyl-L-alanine amidase